MDGVLLREKTIARGRRALLGRVPSNCIGRTRMRVLSDGWDWVPQSQWVRLGQTHPRYGS